MESVAVTASMFDVSDPIVLRHRIKKTTCWLSTGTVNLSSGKAEIHALTSATPKTLFSRTVTEWFQIKTTIRLHVQEGSAQNQSERAGVGRMKHQQIKHTWLQEWATLTMDKTNTVRMEGNAADLLDEQVTLTAMKRILPFINFSIIWNP